MTFYLISYRIGCYSDKDAACVRCAKKITHEFFVCLTDFYIKVFSVIFGHSISQRSNSQSADFQNPRFSFRSLFSAGTDIAADFQVINKSFITWERSLSFIKATLGIFVKHVLIFKFICNRILSREKNHNLALWCSLLELCFEIETASLQPLV